MFSLADPTVRESRTATALAAVRATLSERSAVAFVHAGTDPDLAYVGLDSGAVVVTPNQAVALVAPTADATGLADSVDVRVVSEPSRNVARVVSSLVADGDDARVLSPRQLPHDVALYVEQAGFELTSTPVVADARAVKTPDEQTALRHLGDAASAGADRAARLLSEAVVAADGTLEEREGAADALTPERIRRAVGVELARAGVDAHATRVRGTRGDTLQRGRPVVVDCRPRGPAGTRLRVARTFVVDGDGGWQRRAHVALEAARRAATGRVVDALDDGGTAGTVAAELRAELGAYGFDDPTVAVHGVGLSEREEPLGDTALEPGQTLVLDAVVGRDDEAVALAETLLLGDETVERLAPASGPLAL